MPQNKNINSENVTPQKANKILILGVYVDNVTMQEALAKVCSYITDGAKPASYRLLSEATAKQLLVFTPNAEIMMMTQRDPDLKAILNGDINRTTNSKNSTDVKNYADVLVVADGAGVVLGSHLLHTPLHEKVSGYDLVIKIFETASTSNTSITSNTPNTPYTNAEEYKNRLKVFLFGSKPDVAAEAAAKIEERYPGVKVSGYHHGYYKHKSEEEQIIKMINDSEATILLVALGAPKQEKWIHQNHQALNPSVLMGVGGTLDILSGRSDLSPDFFRRNGLEWLYRLYKEPRRFMRMLDLPRFILRVIFSSENKNSKH